MTESEADSACILFRSTRRQECYIGYPPARPITRHSKGIHNLK